MACIKPGHVVRPVVVISHAALGATAYLEAWNMAVPGSVVLRMLRCYSCCGTIWPSKYNGDADCAG